MSIGIQRGSTLYNALLKNSIIQLSLLKPKVLFAFLHLLSSGCEPNASRWLNEPEISPIISQIFKVYSNEKQCANTSVHPFIAHRASQSRSYSIDDPYTSDYSTYLIPEILSNLSLNDNPTNQERSDSNWTENDHATLV